ncbi:MAG: hypothetical protein HPY67_03940 [Syntrophaceae bacterium]|nr:hypothetical protein [Syntrophaceae bacterium]
MRKGWFLAVAALLVLAMPLSAMGKTVVTKYNDKDVDYWEFCPFDAGSWPYGPGVEWGRSVVIRYVGTEKMNVRVKDDGVDLGWNRNVHGTAYIYDADAVTGSDGGWAAAASSLPRISVHNNPNQWLYPVCIPYQYFLGGSPNPALIPPEALLYQGPFQVEEVLQDDGNQFGCWDGVNPVNFAHCFIWQQRDWTVLDYLMHHVKITGNKVYFWKTTIHEPGKICVEDKRGLNSCNFY